MLFFYLNIFNIYDKIILFIFKNFVLYIIKSFKFYNLFKIIYLNTFSYFKYFLESIIKIKQILQNCNNIWYINIKSIIVEFMSASSNTIVVKKVLIEKKRDKNEKWKIWTYIISLFYR